MFKKTTKLAANIAIVAGILVFALPGVANANPLGQKETVQVAEVLQQAEHEAFNIVRHLKQVKNEINKVDQEGKRGEKELREIEAAIHHAKSPQEKKAVAAKIERIKHGLSQLGSRIHNLKGQLIKGRHLAENLIHHLDGRSQHLEQEIKRVISEIKTMEKDKKKMAEVEKGKRYVEKMEQELHKTAAFLNNLKRELKHI